MIPKIGGGERALGIPTIRDRVVQTAAKLVLEPIFEADWVSLTTVPTASAKVNVPRVGDIDGSRPRAAAPLIHPTGSSELKERAKTLDVRLHSSQSKRMPKRGLIGGHNWYAKILFKSSDHSHRAKSRTADKQDLGLV